MSTKRCLLTNQPIVGIPGQVINVYGHQFIVQKDGVSAIAEINESFIKAELKTGRYKVLENEPKKLKFQPRKDLTSDLGFEFKNFYGFDNINKLYKKIKRLNKEETIEFAETRLQLKFPDHMTHSSMVDEISKNIQSQIKLAESAKQSTLNDLDDLESKIKKSGDK